MDYHIFTRGLKYLTRGLLTVRLGVPERLGGDGHTFTTPRVELSRARVTRAVARGLKASEARRRGRQP